MLKTIILFKNSIEEFVKSKYRAENIFIACKAEEMSDIKWDLLSELSGYTIGTILIPDNTSFIEYCILNLGAKLESNVDTGFFDEGKIITRNKPSEKIYTVVKEPMSTKEVSAETDITEEDIDAVFEEEETKGISQDILPKDNKNDVEEVETGTNPFEFDPEKESIPEINIAADKIMAASEKLSENIEGDIEENEDYVDDNIRVNAEIPTGSDTNINVSEESILKAAGVSASKKSTSKKTKSVESEKEEKPKKAPKERKLTSKEEKMLKEYLIEVVETYKYRGHKHEANAVQASNIAVSAMNSDNAEMLAEDIAYILEKKNITQIMQKTAEKLLSEKEKFLASIF